MRNRVETLKFDGSPQRLEINVTRAERSFKPTFAEDLFNKDQVKSLRVICAAKIRRFGDQIKIDELPYECQVLVKYLPKLLTENPNTQLSNENTNAAANSVEGSAKKRVLPSWMKPHHD